MLLELSTFHETIQHCGVTSYGFYNLSLLHSWFSFVCLHVQGLSNTDWSLYFQGENLTVFGRSLVDGEVRIKTIEEARPRLR